MDELCLCEKNKENIVRLPKGRDIKDLLTALTKPSLVQKQRRKFELELRSYSGDDHMDVWWRYIKWVRQMDIRGKTANQLVRKCVIENYKNADLKNDKRFVSVCIFFAQGAFEPIKMFDLLYNYGIGQHIPDFYIAYATHVEDIGDLDKADGIYKKALDLGFKSLEPKYVQFKKRMVIRGEIAKKEGEERERMEEEERLDEEFNNQLFGATMPTKRSTLAALEPVGRSTKAPVIRAPLQGKLVAPQVLKPEKSGNKGNFKVYTADQENRSQKTKSNNENRNKASTDKDPQQHNVTTTESSSNIFFDELQRQLKQQQLENIPHNEDLVTCNKLLQENKRKATKWAGVKVKQSTPAVVHKKVEVFRDEEGNEKCSPNKGSLTIGVLKHHSKQNPMTALLGTEENLGIVFPTTRAFVGLEEFSLEELMALDYYNGKRTHTNYDGVPQDDDKEAEDIATNADKTQVYASNECHNDQNQQQIPQLPNDDDVCGSLLGKGNGLLDGENDEVGAKDNDGGVEVGKSGCSKDGSTKSFTVFMDEPTVQGSKLHAGTNNKPLREIKETDGGERSKKNNKTGFDNDDEDLEAQIEEKNFMKNLRLEMSGDGNASDEEEENCEVKKPVIKDCEMTV